MLKRKHDQGFHIVGKTSNRLVVLRVERVNDSFRFGILQIGDQFCVFHSHDQCMAGSSKHRYASNINKMWRTSKVGSLRNENMQQCEDYEIER